jgi:hypothetical protein
MMSSKYEYVETIVSSRAPHAILGLGSVNRAGGASRGDHANGVRYSPRVMELLRALRPAQAGGTKFASRVAQCETSLALCDLGTGRLDQATRRMRQCVSDLERADPAHPDSLTGASPNDGFEDALEVQLVLIELSVGKAREARRAAERIGEVVGPLLQSQPDLRHAGHRKTLGLLVESLLDVQEGRVHEASRAADEAAGEIESLKLPLLQQEHFDLGLAHALFCAAGRPAGPGRPARAEHVRQARDERTENRRPDGIPLPHDHGAGRRASGSSARDPCPAPGSALPRRPVPDPGHWRRGPVTR